MAESRTEFRGTLVLAVQAVLVLAALVALWGVANGRPMPSRPEFGSLPDGWTAPLDLLLQVSAGLLALVAAVRYPFVGVLVYIFLMHGTPRHQPGFQFLLENHVPDVVTALTLSGYCGRLFVRRAWPFAIGSKLFWVLLAFVMWMAVSATTAWANGDYQPELKYHPLRWLDAFCLFVIAADCLRDRRDYQLLGFAWGITLMLRVVYHQEPIELNGDLAALLVMAIPLVLLAGRLSAHLALRGIAGALLVALLAVLFHTKNRGAAVAIMASLPCLLLGLSAKRALLGTIVLAGIVALAWYVPSEYRQRFLHILESNDSSTERLALWRAGAGMVRDDPWRGAGPGNFAHIVGRYAPGLANMSPHNNFVAVASEMGMPGLLLYTLFYLAAVCSLLRTVWADRTAWCSCAAAVVLAGLVAHLVAGCFLTRPTEVLAFVLAAASWPFSRFPCTAGSGIPGSCRTAQTPPLSVTNGHSMMAERQKSGALHRPQHSSPRTLHLAVAALAYTGFVVYGSLVPFHYHSVAFATAAERFRNIPLLSIGANGRADLVANILLFMPLGFLWLAVLSVDRKRWLAFVAALLVLPLGIGLGIAVEFTQIWFSRTVSLNDIYAESCGAVLGIGLWLLGGQRFVNWIRSYTGDLRANRQVDWLLQAYCLGFVVYSLIPFDLTISLHELHEKYVDGKIQLVPFAYPYASWFDLLVRFSIDTLVYVPVGALIVTQLLRRKHRIYLMGSCVAAVLFAAAGIEFGQLIVYSRVVDTTDVILGSLGGVIGGWLTFRLHAEESRTCTQPVGMPSRARALWCGLAATIYLGILAAGFWYPYDFVRDPVLIRSRFEGFWSIPLATLYVGTEFNWIRQTLLRVLLFMILGGLSAGVATGVAANARSRRVMVCVLLGLCYVAAFGLEFVQILLPSHVADGTEVVLCMLGATLGMFLVIRLQPQQFSRSDPKRHLVS